MNRRTGASDSEKDHSEVPQSKPSESVMMAQKSTAVSSRTRESRQRENENVYGSVERQNFVILSILLASICGCFSILTLTCSLPAILASIRVSRGEDELVKVAKLLVHAQSLFVRVCVEVRADSP